MSFTGFIKTFFSDKQTTPDSNKGFTPLKPTDLFIPSGAALRQCYEMAFNYVTSRIQARANIFKPILAPAATAFTQGETGNLKKIFEGLGSHEWIWPEYAHWFEIFSAKGEWPYMWEKYQGVCLPEGPPDKPDPETFKRFLKFLKITEVKDWSLKAGLDIPPKAKRDELDDLIIRQIGLAKLKEADQGKFQATEKQYREYRQKHLAYLLEHTISATANHIRDLSEMGKASYSLRGTSINQRNASNRSWQNQLGSKQAAKCDNGL